VMATDHTHSCVTLTICPEPRVSALKVVPRSAANSTVGGGAGGGASAAAGSSTDARVPVAIELLQTCASADIPAVLRYPHRYRVGTTVGAPSGTHELVEALSGAAVSRVDAATSESSEAVLARALFANNIRGPPLSSSSSSSSSSSRGDRNAWMQNGSTSVMSGAVASASLEALHGHESGDVLLLLTPSISVDGSRCVNLEVLRPEACWPEV